MSKILAVEVPDEVYSSLREFFREETSQQIGEIFRGFLKEQSRRLNDPIFEPITVQGSGTTDISEQHDRYLYGD